jgi:small conductance mechanosensitive channel
VDFQLCKDSSFYFKENLIMDFNAIIQAIGTFLSEHWLQVVYAIIILFVGRWLAKVISQLVSKALTKAKVDPTLTSFAQSLSYVGLLIFVVIAALTKLGIEMSQVTVVIGAAGLAVAFALQGSLSNFAAGVLLVVFKPFKVGDFVELAGKAGTVKEIEIFNTVINSPDNVKIIIPNGQVTGSNIMNYTVNGTRRIDLVIGVAYESDLKKTKQLIEEIISRDDRILKEPAFTIAVSELGDSSIDFVVRPWVKASDYWDVKFDITETILLSLDKNGISIPYQQIDINIKNLAQLKAQL